VPPEFVEVPPPPPHAPSRSTSSKGDNLRIRQAERFLGLAFGNRTTPSRAAAQSHELEPFEVGDKAAIDGAVVVTVTLNGVAVVALTFIVVPEGNEQFAPCGAPVQVSDAMPEKPPPPIVSL